MKDVVTKLIEDGVGREHFRINEKDRLYMRGILPRVGKESGGQNITRAYVRYASKKYREIVENVKNSLSSK